MPLSESHLQGESFVIAHVGPIGWPSTKTPTLSTKSFTFFFFLLALHFPKISRPVNWLELKLQCLLLYSPKPLKTPDSFYL